METLPAKSRDDLRTHEAAAGRLSVRRNISTSALIEPALGFTSLCASLFWAAALAIPGALAARLGDGGDTANRIARFGARLITRSCGATVEMRGAEHLAGLGPAVIVANHNSIADIITVAGYLPRAIRFVAKKEVLRIPVIGPAIERSGHIVVDRQRGAAIRKALQVASRGCSIVVFAEGRRYRDEKVHDFKHGAAWIALRTGLPCVPMAISGGGEVFPQGARYVRVGRKITFTFGAPIAARDLAGDRRALTRRLESAVRDLLQTDTSPTALGAGKSATVSNPT